MFPCHAVVISLYKMLVLQSLYHCEYDLHQTDVLIVFLVFSFLEIETSFSLCVLLFLWSFGTLGVLTAQQFVASLNKIDSRIFRSQNIRVNFMKRWQVYFVSSVVMELLNSLQLNC